MALLALLASAGAWTPVAASDVSLIGTFGASAAILSIDSGPPRTLKVGQNAGPIKLISVEQDQATIEMDGKRRVLKRGQTYSNAGSGPQKTTLAVGAGGHFYADGQINGGTIRFVVDTGATVIALPASDAQRLRIDYLKGRRGQVQTAAGPTTAYGVVLASVRVGGIELQNVEAAVIEQGLNVALLGNSFLNRMEMRREGELMTLTRRF